MISSTVKNGRIERVKEHKMLGTWFDETGEYGINIRKKKEKLQFMISTIRNQGSPAKVGKYAIETRLKLAETVVIPSLLYNAEAFAYYKEKDVQELESIQLAILTGILEVPNTTPYCALLMETGWWTMRARLAYKKLMLYHNILRSDDKRVIKRILKEQEKEERETTWYSNIKKLKATYGIELEAEKNLKSAWKKHVKRKIAEKTEKDVRELCSEKKKARIVQNDQYERKEYFGKVPLNEARKITKTRMCMNKIPGNYKHKGVVTCPLCEEGEGSTEHYFECSSTKYLSEVWDVKKEDLKSQDTQKMKDVANFMEKVEEMLKPIDIIRNEVKGE